MLQIAKILKSNGTDGGILVGLYDCCTEDFDLKEPVYIEFDGLPVPFFIESIQPKGTTKAIMHITDVCSLEDAEEIVGRPMFLDAEWEDDDEPDFTGWTVFDRGQELGTVTGSEPIPGNYCIYVGEIMIPLHEDFVISADPEARRLDLDLPVGLY